MTNGKNRLTGGIPRIGYAAGSPQRINERVIDGQWVGWLGQYADLASIPPLQLYRLFGGTVREWTRRFPASLPQLSEGLRELGRIHGIRMLYVNLPVVLPYFLMARHYAGIDMGFLFIAHCVASESWLRQWIAAAPWLSRRDVMLAGTATCKEALTNIAPGYAAANEIPLAVSLPGVRKRYSPSADRPRRLLSIGRIEDVKNIDLLLECFAAMAEQMPDLELTIAGEWTGSSAAQCEAYKQTLHGLVARCGLEGRVVFTGPVMGEAKDELFRRSDLLINLSTDPGETFGYNLIEAKAWGVPAICTYWDGFRELVEHGADGYLVDCRWERERPLPDGKQVVDRCLSLLSDPVVLKQFSRRCAERAGQFRHQSIFPRIAACAGDSLLIAAPAADADAARLAGSRVSELGHLLRLPNLRKLPFVNERLVDLPVCRVDMPMREWMPLVKPIIGHYAGVAGGERDAGQF